MFLKYLVDKKFINSEQALDVAIEYLEGRPSLLKTIKSEGIIESEKLMEIYFTSAIEKKSFYEVFSRDSGLIDEDLRQLFKAQHMGGKSMGQIIVDQGILPQEKWESALRDYLKDNEASDSATISTKAPKSETVAETAAPAGISAAALESLREVSGLDPAQLSELEAQMGGGESADSPSDKASSEEDAAAEMMAMNMDLQKETSSNSPSEENSIYREEYFSTHNEDLQSELLVVANRYRLKKREKDLSLFHQNMAKVLSLAKLSEFHYIEKLLTPYDNLINHIMDDNTLNPQNWDTLVAEMLDLLWKFRKQLSEGMSEAEIIANIDMKKNYIENIKSIMTYIKREK